MARFNAPDVGYADNTSYVTDAKGYPVGATAVAVKNGTGAISKGDAVRFGDDPTEYGVAADLSGPGSLTLAAPGLTKALAPAELPVSTTNSDPAKGAASKDLAALYNSLTTEAAQAYLLADPKGAVLVGGLAASHGVPFYQWLNGINGLSKPKEYSGPAGVTEIETIPAKLKAIEDAAAAASKAQEAARKAPAAPVAKAA